jgi:hypothetical protein
MEFTDWMWLKLIVITVGAFVYGIYLGFKGR